MHWQEYYNFLTTLKTTQIIKTRLAGLNMIWFSQNIEIKHVFYCCLLTRMKNLAKWGPLSIKPVSNRSAKVMKIQTKPGFRFFLARIKHCLKAEQRHPITNKMQDAKEINPIRFSWRECSNSTSAILISKSSRISLYSILIWQFIWNTNSHCLTSIWLETKNLWTYLWTYLLHRHFLANMVQQFHLTKNIFQVLLIKIVPSSKGNFVDIIQDFYIWIHFVYSLFYNFMSLSGF